MRKFLVCFAALSALGAILVLVLLGVIGAMASDVDFALDEQLFDQAGESRTTTYLAYCDGELREIYQSYTGGRQTSVSIEDVSEYLRLGFVSAEDRRFYSHGGFDIKRTLGAALNCVFHFRSDFGGSTITQQVVKNISGDSKKTFRRKITEIIRAYHIEKNHTKDEILELYMNIVPMSRNIYGVEEAARRYFGKGADKLSLSESATIVGIVNAPGRYDPINHPDDCLHKRNRVLYAMWDCGAISEEEYNTARSERLGVSDHKRTEEFSSWFVESAREEVIEDLCSKYSISESAASVMLSRGARVILTVDMEVQRILEKTFENEDNLPAECKDGLNYAMVVNDVFTGNTLGIIGSALEKRGDRLFNMATAKRPPASALKPLSLYAPMIDDGTICWSTVLDDTPVSFTEREGEYIPYPRNSPDVYDGLTTVSDAIRRSKNTVAVRLYEMRGATRIADDLSRIFGIEGLSAGKGGRDTAASPLALGQLTQGISLRTLTNAYTVFPAEGVRRGGKCYLGVFSSDGRVLLQSDSEEERVLKPETARIMNMLLCGVTDSGTARRIQLKELIDTAGKTGTSSGDKDRYFVGYTPYYCAGIRVGYNEADKPIGTLNPSHLDIWDKVMTEIHERCVFSVEENLSSFSTDGLKILEYCRDSGELVGEKCALDPRGDRFELGYFTEDNKPESACRRHIGVLYDSEYGAIATDGCEELTEIALVEVERRFPCEVIITDAEYVFRGDPTMFSPNGYDNPYFYEELGEGEYVGRGRGKKQFNSGCYIHSGK